MSHVGVTSWFRCGRPVHTRVMYLTEYWWVSLTREDGLRKKQPLSDAQSGHLASMGMT